MRRALIVLLVLALTATVAWRLNLEYGHKGGGFVAYEKIIANGLAVMIFGGICMLIMLGWWIRYCDRQLRQEAGHCPNCDYDLTGNTSGRCPECGERI